MICWKCREAVGSAVCVSCGSIQPPGPNPDYFTALGLPRSYFVDTGELAAAHRAISKQVHPDRFRKRGAVERRMSLQWSATVNEAKRVLLDPLARARYLATGSAIVDEEQGTGDAEFLEHIFELQMLAMSDPETAKANAEAELNDLRGQLEQLFRSWEAEAGTLDAAEKLLTRWSYLEKLMNRI